MDVKSISDSLWFNAIMIVVSVLALGEKLLANYLSGNYYQNLIMIVIWIVLLFHFIIITKNKMLEKSADSELS